jgi:hypothetical protein
MGALIALVDDRQDVLGRHILDEAPCERAQ